MWDIVVDNDILFISDGDKRYKIGSNRFAQNRELALHEISRRVIDPTVADFRLPPMFAKSLLRTGVAKLSLLLHRIGRKYYWRDIASLTGILLAKAQKYYIPNPDSSFFTYFTSIIYKTASDFKYGTYRPEYSDFFPKPNHPVKRGCHITDSTISRSFYSSIIDDSDQKGSKYQPIIPYSALTERKRYIIEKLYEDNMTLQQVGDILGISRERVRQLHEDALHSLRFHLKEITIIPTFQQIDPPSPETAPLSPETGVIHAAKRQRRLSKYHLDSQQLINIINKAGGTIEKRELIKSALHDGPRSFSTYHLTLNKMIKDNTLIFNKFRCPKTGLIKRYISIAST